MGGSERTLRVSQEGLKDVCARFGAFGADADGHEVELEVPPLVAVGVDDVGVGVADVQVVLHPAGGAGSVGSGKFAAGADGFVDEAVLNLVLNNLKFGVGERMGGSGILCE